MLHADRRPLEGPARSFALKTSRRTLQDAVVGADVLVGLSRTGALTSDTLRRMAPRPVVVALAGGHLGEPELLTTPPRAGVLHASANNQCKHQATDLLVLPGLMRGAIDVDAAFVDDAIRVAAVQGDRSTGAWCVAAPTIGLPRPSPGAAAASLARGSAPCTGGGVGRGSCGSGCGCRATPLDVRCQSLCSSASPIAYRMRDSRQWNDLLIAGRQSASCKA